MQSQILRISSGYINQVNDPVPGLSAVPGGTGVSPYFGQVGKWLDLDDSALKFNSSVGTVWGGRFQYVKLAATATSNPAVGQIVFWDDANAASEYEVTTLEDASSTPNAVQIAGIVLSNVWTAGYYSIIQTVGLVNVKFRAVLTSAGQLGSSVYAAGAGAGADNGLADVIASATPTQFGDVTLMQARFLGVAQYTAPTGGGTSRVSLGFTRYRE
ncbi:MAG: hypothetical protein AB7T37_15735 [Dehalococcoidia bacterium]